MPAAETDRRDRLLALAALAAPVLAGVIGFWLGGAPNTYSAVNLAALLLAGLLLLVPAIRQDRWPETVACAVVVLLAASLLLGPETEGVRRWIAIGPVRLHCGMLILPALAAALPHLARPYGAATVAACAALILLQPDLASASALFLGVVAGSSGIRPDGYVLLMRGSAAAGLVAAAFRPDPLSSVRFVETALADGWSVSPLLGAAMAASLAAAVLIAPSILTRTAPQLRHSARGLTAAMAGFVGLSLILPYPQPLIGFGASPILGFGLALAVLRQLR